MIDLRGRRITKPMAWRSTGGTGSAAAWRTQYPVLIAERCVGCNICWKYCPEPAIAPAEGKGTMVAIDMAACKGCGVCAVECPKDAIAMVEEVA